MASEIKSNIEGEFNGFNNETIFFLANGQAWQQSRYRYRYKYAYRPQVRIYRETGRHMMQVAGIDEPIEVVPVDIVLEGKIVSDFVGFDGQSRFEFQNGQIWEQAEYKYSYHYAYMPNALIINGLNGYQLRVEGMDEPVRVRRIK